MTDNARDIGSPFAFIGPGGDEEKNLFDFTPRVERIERTEAGVEDDPKDLFAPGSAGSSDLASTAQSEKSVPIVPSTPPAVGLEDVEKGSTPPREYEPSSTPTS